MAISEEDLKLILWQIEQLVSVVQGLFAAQKEWESKELLARLHQEKIESTLQRDMLQYLIKDHVEIDIDDSLLRSREGQCPS